MIVTSIRMELRGLGLIDSRDNCWSFFIERIRRQLKVRRITHLMWSSVYPYKYHIYFFCLPGCLVFLPSWIYLAYTGTEIPSSGKLYCYRLVSLLASACSRVCQHYFYWEDTWIRGENDKLLKCLQVCPRAVQVSVKFDYIFLFLCNIFLQPNVRSSISEFISYAHTSVNEVRLFFKNMSRHYAKTPFYTTLCLV